jgi:hypothetical protein
VAVNMSPVGALVLAARRMEEVEALWEGALWVVRSDIWDCCLDNGVTKDARRLAPLEAVLEAGEPGEGGAGRDAVRDVTLPCLLIETAEANLLLRREPKATSLGLVAEGVVASSWGIWSGMEMGGLTPLRIAGWVICN